MGFLIQLWTRGRGPFMFMALTGFFIGITFAWLWLDRSPSQWDDSWYLTNSLVMYDALAEGGVIGYARRFLTILGTKPPLMSPTA